MSFLNPSYLWALLGLIIPVAIHLWSNKEGRTIKIGSVQFLEALDVKQTNSVKLNELWLLFLRMLIITVLVFIIAEPQIKREELNVPITYLVEPSLLKNTKFNSLVDSLKQNSSIRLLESGFPELEAYNQEAKSVHIPNYWQLAKEMEDLPADSIVVFTNGYFQGFKGKRPLINKDVAWIVLDAEVYANEILEIAKKGGKLEVLELIGDQQKLSFKKQSIPLNSDELQFNATKDSVRLLASNEQNWVPIKKRDSLAVLIYYEEELETTKLYLESSFNAISKYLDRPIALAAVQDTTGINWETYHFIIWLSEKPSYKFTQASLKYSPDSLANSLIEPGASKNTFHLTNSLTAKNTLSENLPEQLLKFMNLNKELENKVQNLDRRTMDSKEINTRFVEAASKKSTLKLFNISKWFWLLLIFLMVSERIFARYRKQ